MASSSRFFFLIFVPIFGLLSCAKDKPAAPAPVEIKDPWLLTVPTLESTAGHRTKVTELDNRVLGAAAVFHLIPAEVRGTKVKITTECRSGQKHESVQLISKDLANIPLLSLLPRNVAENYTAEDLNVMSCEFTFLYVNKIGSKHDFDIHNAKIDFSDLESNLVVGDSKVTNSEIEFTALKSMKLNLTPAPPSIMDWHLKCDLLDVHRHDLDPVMSTAALSSLITSAPRQVQFTGKVHQVCSLFAASTDNQTGLPIYWLKKNLRVKFPVPQPDIQILPILRHATHDSFQSEHALDIKVKNTSDHRLVFRFPKNPGHVIYLQGISNDGRGAFASTAWPAQITDAVITGSRYVMSAGDEFQFPIDAHTEVEIYAGFGTDKDCLNTSRGGGAGQYGMALPLPKSLFNGFTFAFEEPIFLKELVDYDESKAQVGEIASIPLQVPIYDPGQAELPGWAPLQIPGRTNLSRPRMAVPRRISPSDRPANSGVPYTCSHDQEYW